MRSAGFAMVGSEAGLILVGSVTGLTLVSLDTRSSLGSVLATSTVVFATGTIFDVVETTLLDVLEG